MFDTLTNTWSALLWRPGASMLTARHGIFPVAIAHRITVMGRNEGRLLFVVVHAELHGGQSHLEVPPVDFLDSGWLTSALP